MIRKNLCLAAVLTGLFLAGHSSAVADIFTYVDGAGNRHYTNAPVSSSCKPLRQGGGAGLRRPGSEQWLSRVEAINPNGAQGLRHRAVYDRQILRVGQRYNVDPFLIKAMIKTESDFNCFARSRKGAQGLMQLMPDTARALDVDNPFDPAQNIDGGTRYLRSLLEDFNGNLVLSLAAYNAGPTLVKRDGRVPRIPETVKYVKRVLSHYKGYKAYASGGRNTVPSIIRVGTLVTVNE